MKTWLQWFVLPIVLLMVGFYAGRWQGRNESRERQKQIVDYWQQQLRQEEADSQQVIHEESKYSDEWIDCQRELAHSRMPRPADPSHAPEDK